ncbi:hypothetical protein SEPCBS57363_001838 [Sporothrix epigloea]|uniref:Small ribosomal subunit protein bS18m n=1 Tax=Sporothrix epigloea TaxID=1892477 RepID=A0ABP0DCH3_9PEZI
MPLRMPRIPIPSPAPCTGYFAALSPQRFAIASIHSTTPRQQTPSSGASFLNLDKESETARSAGETSSAASSQTWSRAPRYTAVGVMNNSDANSALRSLLRDAEARRHLADRRNDIKRTTLERMTERKVSDEYARQLPRRWNQGDVYAPYDLSHVEALKWKRAAQPMEDVVDMLGINPLDEYRNFRMVSDFMSSMGRIRPSMETALRPVNQRRMAKAIRRAIGLGIHPSVHKHPEILAASIAGIPKPAYVVPPDNRKKSHRV